jgi:hypothetical protein
MSDSTRLGRARGKMLPVAIVAAAMLAMLAIAPFASAAAPSPLASGTTTLTINSGFANKAKQAGIKITPVKPAKIKGTKATFAVTGGSLELVSGAGEVTHSGGLKIAWGKKSAALKSFTVNTTTKSLSAKVGGKTLKVATLVGPSVARLGFGDSISAKKVKLTGAGANALNKALTPAPKKVKIKKKKRGKTVIVTKTIKTKPPFKANMVLGSSVTEVEPTTVNVQAKENLNYNGDATLLGKLKDVGVEVQTISPTTATGNLFTSGISGGTISPLGTSGAVTSSGGIKLVQVLKGKTDAENIVTEITLGSIGVDLAAKTATVEVIGKSNAKDPSTGKEPLNVGNLGRSSIADLTITSSTPSPATRSVVVNATSTIQPVAAEVLQGFVSVYQGYYAQVFAATLQAEIDAMAKPPMTEAQIKEAAANAAAEKVANDQIKSGESLGSFSFTALGE